MHYAVAGVPIQMAAADPGGGPIGVTDNRDSGAKIERGLEIRRKFRPIGRRFDPVLCLGNQFLDGIGEYLGNARLGLIQ